MTLNPNAELIQRYLNGDRSAFEQIVCKYLKQVYNFIRCMTGNPDDADAVTQVVFLEVNERLNTFDMRNDFIIWLYKIAVEESLKHGTHEKGTVDTHRYVRANMPEVSELMKNEDICGELKAALGELTPEERVVIILKHLEHFSYSQIAAILDISERMVVSRIFSARAQLRDVLVHTIRSG
jgi:RNA polymerase sigma-70 factor, ECF subfamily